jgi:hypothetical protein
MARMKMSGPRMTRAMAPRPRVARAGALVVRAGVVRGVGKGAGATCGTATGSELPAMEEG